MRALIMIEDGPDGRVNVAMATDPPAEDAPPTTARYLTFLAYEFFKKELGPEPGSTDAARKEAENGTA